MPNNNYGMQMVGSPNPYNQEMPQKLESMYPTTYNIIKPEVDKVCENMTHPNVDNLSKEHMEKMVDEVYDKVEAQVEKETRDGLEEDERQFYGPGRRVLRDFIGALIIGQLIGRRPYYPMYGYPVYGYAGYGYPGYYGSPYGGYMGY